MDTRKTLQKLNEQYPARQNRYFGFGWNANAQDCYTPEDKTLLTQIQDEYRKLLPSNNDKPFFATEQEKAWWDFWKCDRPTMDGKAVSFTERSFTLPNRETKDSKTYPLWTFADNRARQIANWQAERVAQSTPEVINDPTMLVLEELRDWFFHTLTEKQGKPEDLQYITARQNYINNLVHKLPDFGADRLHLHELSNMLDEAYNIVLASIANRELPQLLTGTIIDARSLENTIGTYLHHLIVNEKVDDNFSMSCLDSSDNVCSSSPVRKVYDAAKVATATAQTDAALARYQEKGSLYALSPVGNNNQLVKHELRTDAANAVQFASFVTDADKKNYVEALAMLEALTNVRVTLENFQSLQAKIGTYWFAYSYLDKANQLASNYNALVVKITNLLGRLINTADNGLHDILADNTNKYKKINIQFEKNLRALQTKVVKDTTLKNQLDAFSRKAINSMNVYSGKMAELVSDLKSGKASDEIKREMQGLYTQLSDLNVWLVAMLNDEQLKIDLNQDEQCHDMTFSAKCAKTELLLESDTHEEAAEQIEQSQVVVPTRLDAVIAAATRSAGYGAMRGATNVMNNTMQTHGYSQQIASISSQLAYYSMYFASRFYANYDAGSNTANFEAMQHAALETGQMWVTSTVLNHVSQYLSSAGESLERNKWTYTGAGLKKLGSLTYYGLFAVTAATSDPVEAVVGFAAGSAAEAVTERALSSLTL